MTNFERIAQAIGPESARAIIRIAGGCIIRVPKELPGARESRRTRIVVTHELNQAKQPYGLELTEAESIKQIAKDFCISRRRVRQILAEENITPSSATS
jgi:hypothetical protein